MRQFTPRQFTPRLFQFTTRLLTPRTFTTYKYAKNPGKLVGCLVHDIWALKSRILRTFALLSSTASTLILNSRCRCGTSLTEIPLVPPGKQTHWRRIVIPLTPLSFVSSIQSGEPASQPT